MEVSEMDFVGSWEAREFTPVEVEGSSRARIANAANRRQARQIAPMKEARYHRTGREGRLDCIDLNGVIPSMVQSGNKTLWRTAIR